MALLNRIKSKLNRIKLTLSEKLMTAPSDIESKRIYKLRSELKGLANNKALATDFWAKKREELYNVVAIKDPRNFTNWPVMYPMFFNPDPLELKSLQNENNWDFIKKLIIEDKIGNPVSYKDFPKSSGNLIHHTYSLVEYMKQSGNDPKTMNIIIEFGGGYGSFCRLLYKSGFRGTYIIYDLPEYSAFQDYFLSSLSMDLKIVRNEIINEPGTVCLISDVKLIENSINADLFIALWSLSECPIELRENFYEQINKSSSLLIGFQEKFENIANLDYFNSKFGQNPNSKIIAINHMSQNYYLFK